MRTLARIVLALGWLACARVAAQDEPGNDAPEPAGEPDQPSAPPDQPSAEPEAPKPEPARPSAPASPRLPSSWQPPSKWQRAQPPAAAPQPQAPRDQEKPSAPASPDQGKPGTPEEKAPAKHPEEAFGEHRVLGGHAFPLAAFVTTPFVTSYVSVRGGIEFHNVPGFAKPIALFATGGSERVDLQTLSVTEAVDFEVRLVDWLAVFGSGYGRVRAGVNAPTLLGNGGDYRYGGDAGALLKVLRIGNFQLALRGQLGYYAGQQAGILGLFQDLSAIVNDALARVQEMPTLDLNATLGLINNAFISATTELLTPLFGFRYGGSVNAALAFNRYVGVQAALGAFGDQTTYQPRLYDPTLGTTIAHDQVSTTARALGAVALDFNAAPAAIPFDVLVEYSLSYIHNVTTSPGFSETSDSAEQLVALGIYYSGRPDFQLGVTGYTLLGQVPVIGAGNALSGKPLDVGALLVFHYIW
jgi:hypothetical protein